MLAIEFKTPFTRSQLRASIVQIAASFPTLTFSFRVTAMVEDYLATPDAEDDLILGLKVDGFANVGEVGNFLSALPAGASGRIQEVSYK